MNDLKISVAGAGYVGLSMAVLLSQNNYVTALTTTQGKADTLNQFISLIRDSEIEQFFDEARSGKSDLNLCFTTSYITAYTEADIVIVAVPTNSNEQGYYFDTSA